MAEDELDFSEEEDASLEASDTEAFSQAVVYSADWTVETIVSQVDRKNIDMDPRFQRRDAWPPKAKSRFIESVILGLPIPQIVLAEKKNERGKFIVLDGKQRLLSLLQFTGRAEGPNNSFALTGMEARDDLNRCRYRHLKARAERIDDLNSFHNHTIRTVVIRNWPSMQFLHLVFLRLNTGSVKLSPQELRQAAVPGRFSDFIDDAAIESDELKMLLSRQSPDPRMRDVEILVRYVAFQNLMKYYAGRMKNFLDFACKTFNEDWDARQKKIREDVVHFNEAAEILEKVFGARRIARKHNSNSFNRAIFDALIFYAAFPHVRDSMLANAEAVRSAYEAILTDEKFSEAVESDTAGIPHTFDRLRLWGQHLRDATGLAFDLPEQTEIEGAVRIAYARP